MIAPALRASVAVVVAILSMAAAAAPAGAAESVTLAATADSWLNQTNTSQNNGTTTTLSLRNRSGSFFRPVVQFSLAAIPSDASIKLGTLTMFMITAPSASRTYGVHSLTQSWTETGVTWNSRNGTNNWTTAGGTFTAAATGTTVTGTTGNTALSWTVTSDVSAWFTGSLVNNGWLLKDTVTGFSGASTYQSTFASSENGTTGNRPSLTVFYMRKVRDLTATAGNAQTIVSWTPPGTSPSYTGTLVIRRTSAVPTAAPVDGTSYAIDATLADGSVVRFNDSALGTTFTDTGLANGTTYHYQAFARDDSNRYSAVGGTVNATPTDGTAPSSAWGYATEAATLAAPGLDPGGAVVAGSGDNKVHSFNPVDGTRVTTPFSTGGAITARPAVVANSDSTLGQAVTYVTSNDGYVYAIDPATGTQIWKTAVQLGDTIQGGPAAWLQRYKALTFTGGVTTDVVFVGTRNTNAGAAYNNKVYALNGDTGAIVWTFNDGSVGNNFSVNVISSTPYVDYATNAVWFTSQLGWPIGLTRQTLWKVDAATGALAGAPYNFPTTLGSIDSSPVLSYDGMPPATASSFLYTGNNAGQLLAIRLSDGAVFTHTPSAGAGAVRGYPLSYSIATPSVAEPDTLVFTRNTTIHQVTFNGSTFTEQWGGPRTLTGTPTLSAPIDFYNIDTDVTTVYVGASDGKVHEINFTTGVDQKQRSIPGAPTAGDPSVDYAMNQLYVGATDGNVYAFSLPF